MPRKPQKPRTVNQARLRSLYSSGVPVAEIARRLKVSRVAVWRWVCRLDLSRESCTARWPQRKAFPLANRTALALQLGVRRGTVSQALSGRVGISPGLRRDLAAALGVTEEAFAAELQRVNLATLGERKRAA